MDGIRALLKSDEAFYVLGVLAAFIFITFITIRINRARKKTSTNVVADFSFNVGNTLNGSYYIDENTLQSLSDVEPIYKCYLKHNWSADYKEARMKSALNNDDEVASSQNRTICDLLSKTAYTITEMLVDAVAGKGRTTYVRYMTQNGQELNLTTNDQIQWVEMTSNDINNMILKRVKMLLNEDERKARMAASTVATATAMNAAGTNSASGESDSTS